MKALSIRSPWWWFILHGGKDIENRDWYTSYRGPVLLHASSWWREKEVWADCLAARDMAGQAPGFAFPSIDAFRDDIRRLGGHVVGRADIVGCAQRHSSPWFVGVYGFVLANAKPVASPFKLRGRLGLFDTPYDDEFTT